MAVIAKFVYEVQPGRMDDFMAKLKKADDPKFNSEVMPKSFRLLRGNGSEPGAVNVVILIEYEDMAAYRARTDFENKNPEWRVLFSPAPDSPERLVSVELLTDLGRDDVKN